MLDLWFEHQHGTGTTEQHQFDGGHEADDEVNLEQEAAHGHDRILSGNGQAINSLITWVPSTPVSRASRPWNL